MEPKAEEPHADDLVYVDARIDKLTREIASHYAAARCLEARLDEAQAFRRHLAAARDPEPDSLWTPVPRGPRTVTRPTLKPDLDAQAAQKPANAIKAYLANKPEGVPLKSLVDDLLPVIASTSGNKKRLIYNTVHGLKKRGRLTGFTDEQGREHVKMASGDGATSA